MDIIGINEFITKCPLLRGLLEATTITKEICIVYYVLVNLQRYEWDFSKCLISLVHFHSSGVSNKQGFTVILVAAVAIGLA